MTPPPRPLSKQASRRRKQVNAGYDALGHGYTITTTNAMRDFVGARWKERVLFRGGDYELVYRARCSGLNLAQTAKHPRDKPTKDTKQDPPA